MGQYISKSAIIAEIERRIDELCNYHVTESEQLISKGASLKPLMELRLFLNTLEVKEVDLEKEIENYFKGWSEDAHNGAACHYQYVDLQDCKDIARHFFEFGLKTKDQ